MMRSVNPSRLAAIAERRQAGKLFVAMIVETMTR